MITNNTLRAAYPREAAWLTDNYRTHNFATSLVDQARSRGGLSERQLEAVTRILELPAAVEVEMSGVMEAFQAARDSGLKRPKLRLNGLSFSLSKNGDAIYVKGGPAWEDPYYGKVVNGIFRPSRECDKAMADAIVTISDNLIEAATMYGKETGTCGCCGRELTDPDSIEAGIGPVCAKRWNF